MQTRSQAYPNAVKIRLVQDNLNTHSPSSFYQHLPAEEALQLANRFEWYYTPKKASWLNMAELELSAYKLHLSETTPGLNAGSGPTNPATRQRTISSECFP